MKYRYTKDDAGCYADGAFGSDHAREWLRRELESLGCTDPDILLSLRGPAPDDVWDEIEALEFLNQYCDDDVYFAFVNGDLMLVSEESNDD